MSNSSSTPAQRDHMISNGLYDVTKFIALVVLPAAATLYFTLASIWHLPSAEEVIGTIGAVDTFLGVFVHVSTQSYNSSESKFDGAVAVASHVEGDIANKTQVLLKVVKQIETAPDASPISAHPEV